MEREERGVPMRYYISDLHFFHESLNDQMDRRGFGSGQEMNDFMVEQLYGHVHRTRDQRLVEQFQKITRSTLVHSRGQEAPQPVPCQMINCFCMDSGYQPLTLDEWIEVERKRSWGETEEQK